MKNKFFTAVLLYAVDFIILIALAISGAPGEKLAYFAGCGFILNSIIFIIPEGSVNTARFAVSDYIFISAAAAIAAGYAFFFGAFDGGAHAPAYIKAAHPAVFMVFCAAFTLFYFLIKEKPEAAVNE